MKYCPNCGHQLNDDAKFCVSCGTMQPVINKPTPAPEVKPVVEEKPTPTPEAKPVVEEKPVQEPTPTPAPTPAPEEKPVEQPAPTPVVVEEKPVEQTPPNHVVEEPQTQENTKKTDFRGVITIKNRIIWSSAAFILIIAMIIFQYLNVNATFLHVIAELYVHFAMAINIIGFIFTLIRKRPLFEIVLSSALILLMAVLYICSWIIVIGSTVNTVNSLL